MPQALVDYFRYRDRYYLFFSLHWKAHYLVSDKPFEGWRMPDRPTIPCGAVPKGAVWKDRIVFTGFRPLGPYAGEMTFSSAAAAEDGDLRFDSVGESFRLLDSL